MKKALLIFACLLLGGAGFAQDLGPGAAYKPNRNTIKLSPWQLLGRQFEFGYERISKNGKTSLQIMPSVTLRYRNRWDAQISKYSAVEGLAMLRNYWVSPTPTKQPLYRTAVVRPYVAPYYRTKYMQAQYTVGQWTGFTFTDGSDLFEDIALAHEGGFVGGIQLTAWDRFVFDLYLGGGVRYSQIVSDNPFETQIRSDNISNPAYTGIVPRINFSWGVAF